MTFRTSEDYIQGQDACSGPWTRRSAYGCLGGPKAKGPPPTPPSPRQRRTRRLPTRQVRQSLCSSAFVDQQRFGKEPKATTWHERGWSCAPAAPGAQIRPEERHYEMEDEAGRLESYRRCEPAPAPDHSHCTRLQKGLESCCPRVSCSVLLARHAAGAAFERKPATSCRRRRQSSRTSRL